ncbi:cytochrome P450-like protein [Euroglyphus maynei]|uniref:Cytochrome P450-like protein n=1 Tax=Euroglyphus maynei TaxID=6958 RepID=A0A1Y3BBT1_EURMA|nr:cytochrome P450-like protein [Euroglyphus maynei]
MDSITLDVICRLAFNMHNTDVHNEDSLFRKMVVDFMRQTSDPILRIIGYFPFLKKFLSILFHLFGNANLLKTISKKLDNEISKYYMEKLKNNQHQKHDDRKINILDFMIEQQQLGNLNELQLIGNSLVILLAGYETTSTSLTFTFYLLAKHIEWQNKLREEILKNFNNSDDYCQFDQYRSELLDRIWFESLRLYPPVISFITRRLDTGVDKCYINSLDLNITKEMTIMVPTWPIHHDEEYWPQPNQFDPNRNDLPIPGGNVMEKNPAFLAFGNGPRNCIGSNLALSESRAVLVALIKHYRFELIDDQKSEKFTSIDPNSGLLKLSCPNVIIRPEKDIWLRVTKI